jgi:hypothetical protein
VEEGARILGFISLRYSKEIKEFLSRPVEERVRYNSISERAEWMNSIILAYS